MSGAQTIQESDYVDIEGNDRNPDKDKNNWVDRFLKQIDDDVKQQQPNIAIKRRP